MKLSAFGSGKRLSSLWWALFALSLTVRVYNLDEPWLGGHHAFNGAQYSIMARNYLRFGLGETSFAPVLNLGESTPERFHYSLVHPPLLPLTLALSFRVFGIDEWSATLVPVSFSMGSWVLTYLLVRRLWGEGVAYLAAFFLALVPMDAYYGRIVITDVPALFFALLTLWFYVVWLERPKKRWLGAMGLSYFLGMVSDWPAYYIGPLIALHYGIFAYPRIRKRALLLLLPVEALIILTLQLSYIAHLSGSLDWLIRHALWRANPSTEWSFTALEWLMKMGLRVGGLFTPVLGALALAWLASLLPRVRGARRQLPALAREGFALLLLLFGSLHALIFRQNAWIHEYLLFYLSPFFAIAGALGACVVGERFLRSPLRARWGTLGLVLLFVGMATPVLAWEHRRGGAGDPQLIEIMRAIRDRTDAKDRLITSGRLGFALEFYLDRSYEVATCLEEFRTLVSKKGPFAYYLLLPEGQVLRTMHGILTPYVESALKEYLIEHYPAQTFNSMLTAFDLAHTEPNRSLEGARAMKPESQR